jgi:hypothetical protein
VGANSQPGETPSVLAVSWGRGDYQKDDITIVFLDFEGRMREHTRIDNLTDQENQDEFYDLLVRRRPDVIVVGGFSMTTTRLAKDLQTFITGTAAPDSGRESQEHIKVIYNYDEVARLYQHSKRADLEFGGLPELTKYCIGLARYTQSPLNEYAALGQDITAIAFDDRYQHLVSQIHSFCLHETNTFHRFTRTGCLLLLREPWSMLSILSALISTAPSSTRTTDTCCHSCVALDLASLLHSRKALAPWSVVLLCLL